MTTRPFRFGVQAFAAESSREWIGIAQRAEDLGYTTLFTCDHYFGPGEIAERSAHRPVDLAPLTAIAFAAGATTRLRVGCRVFCCDFHHPAVLAKELATLDMLSEGRLEIGLGAGWTAAEYEGLGLEMDPPGVRIARLGEYVGALRAHFSGEQIDVRGTHVRLSGFAGRPLPVQPQPPIMIGGGSPRILRLAGALADVVSFNYDNSAGTLGPAGFASSSHDATVAKLGWVREGAGDRFGEIELEAAAYGVAISDHPQDDLAELAARFHVEPAALTGNPHVAVGSVDSVCDQLRQRREELGITYVTVQHRNMEAFAPVVARLAGT